MSDKPKLIRADPNFNKKRKNLIKTEEPLERVSKGMSTKVLSTTKSQLKSELKFKERMNKSKEPSVEKRNESNSSKTLDKKKKNPATIARNFSKTNIKVVEAIPEQSDAKERESDINLKQISGQSGAETGSGSKIGQSNPTIAQSK